MHMTRKYLGWLNTLRAAGILRLFQCDCLISTEGLGYSSGYTHRKRASRQVGRSEDVVVVLAAANFGGRKRREEIILTLCDSQCRS